MVRGVKCGRLNAFSSTGEGPIYRHESLFFVEWERG